MVLICELKSLRHCLSPPLYTRNISPMNGRTEDSRYVMALCLSVSLCGCLLSFLSVCLSVFSCACVRVGVCVMCMCVSFCMSICMSRILPCDVTVTIIMCLSVCLPVCQSTFSFLPSICESVCPCVCVPRQQRSSMASRSSHFSLMLLATPG